MPRHHPALVWSLVVAFGLLLAVGATAGRAEEAPAGPQGASWVRLKKARIFPIRVARGELDAAARARGASEALAAAAEGSGEVRVEPAGGDAALQVGAATLLVLGPADAAAAGEASVAALAHDAAARLNGALRVERRRLAVQGVVFSVSLAVASALLVFLAARRLGRAAGQLTERLRGHRLVAGGLRVAGAEVARAGEAHTVAAIGVQVVLRLSQAALAYAWLLFALGLLPWTAGAVGRLAAVVFDPAIDLALKLARGIPVLVALALAGLALLAVLRTGRTVLLSVARGESTLRGVPRELARPALGLLQAAVVAAAIVLAGPLLGEATGPGAWPSLALLIGLGLGLAPLLACACAGIPLVFGRALRVGDRVEVSGRAGRVAEVSLLALTLVEDDGARVRVPWLLVAFRPLRVIPAGPAPAAERER